MPDLKDIQRHYRDPHLVTARWISDLYALWRMCPQRACRHAKSCRRDPRMCHYGMALVPPEARDFLDGFDEGIANWLPFHAMMDRNGEAFDALDAWRSAVSTSLLPEGPVQDR
jgi:hypothetical protein